MYTTTNKQYIVKFIWSDNVDKNTYMYVLLHELFERQFVELREEAIKLLNPCYKDWNDEYGPIMDLTDYYTFIRKKQKLILDSVNEKHPYSFIKLESDKECDIIAKIRTNESMTIRIVLVPVPMV